METTPTQEDETTITAETVEAWSIELREFTDTVRQRLRQGGHGAVAEVDETPRSRTSDGSEASDDALQRLHEIKQRLAARRQCD